MTEEIDVLQAQVAREIQDTVHNLEELEAFRLKYLGKKGELTKILRTLGTLPKEERPIIGQKVNELRGKIEVLISSKKLLFEEVAVKERLLKESVDITLPGRRKRRGHLHPLTLTLNRIKNIFLTMGFSIEDGPEIERDYFNFEMLNLPKDHPARDMQDSFYITEEFLLRTQTSPVQARTMQSLKPNTKIRMIAPGKVYRRDDYDATHAPMFTQVEGLVLDENIAFSDLKGILEIFLKKIFQADIGVRFRPSFFPFTEPSAEVDISCVMCQGKGCRVCKNTGWLEILGAGMVHPRVLEMSGYDPAKVSGFAFGMGVERIAMLLYGIEDLRLFYDNDIRFLEQF